MQNTFSDREPHEDPNDGLILVQPTWSEGRQPTNPAPARQPGQMQASAVSPSGFARSDSARGPGSAIVSRSLALALPKDKKITILVIGGPSKGQKYELTKPRASVGRIGGGADIEINDPGASDLHCALGVNQGFVRLCDLNSASGTYVNGERVGAAGLEHLSEFRVGSSVLLVTILPKRVTGTG